MTPRIAVVVALHDDTPEGMVHALAGQTFPAADIEVVLVDGWHAERSRRAVERAVAAVRDRLSVRVIRTERSGRGAAWNRGIAETSAPLLLLLADDFEASPHLVEEHLRLHESRPDDRVIGIGPARFPAEHRASPFMRWLEDEGRLFGVSFTQPAPRRLSSFFYGANTSLKRGFLEAVGPFHEGFEDHGYEDLEMWLRLRPRGAEVVYLERAVAIHRHHIDLDERRRVMREVGRSANLLEGLHPGPHPWDRLRRIPTWAFSANALGWRVLAAVCPVDAVRHRYFNAQLRGDFVSSYRSDAATQRGRPGRTSTM